MQMQILMQMALAAQNIDRQQQAGDISQGPPQVPNQGPPQFGFPRGLNQNPFNVGPNQNFQHPGHQHNSHQQFINTQQNSEAMPGAPPIQFINQGFPPNFGMGMGRRGPGLGFNSNPHGNHQHGPGCTHGHNLAGSEEE